MLNSRGLKMRKKSIDFFGLLIYNNNVKAKGKE
jgi:hypothetical protein